ncbi:hypothetical protein PF005_g27213 [Phytophthora fragariae]|uniref:Uncharacterized protein n=1 Tax=Phytophthora fragariae TaxID=53985 RepID=A0A6A3HK34_9STRA|nr:hypothetical protein PF003_g12635 [Phytophthora fragariae]KAE8936989.1 hypothetical protein PF009_g13091 [Phytophthora fragariae]KAE8970001.1 hypothetical protein PF011_g26587 [Phytophthora fragariae]KAE9068620.1 hypothetical protein PF007_g27618 [Phytophthora fragariae]KAE9086062.1 hypothetical protein PF006_g26107 [Phytophthora fragariae]
MDFDRAEISFSATVDEDVVKVTRCEVTEWAKHMGHHAIERRMRVLQA